MHDLRAVPAAQEVTGQTEASEADENAAFVKRRKSMEPIDPRIDTRLLPDDSFIVVIAEHQARVQGSAERADGRKAK